jgi:hypothetical protein
VQVTNDETAILPVQIGTGIAIVVTGIWWFGVGLIASLSGIFGLVFLHWRAGRIQRKRGNVIRAD